MAKFCPNGLPLKWINGQTGLPKELFFDAPDPQPITIGFDACVSNEDNTYAEYCGHFHKQEGNMRFELPKWKCVFIDGEGKVNQMDIVRTQIPGNTFGEISAIDGLLVPAPKSWPVIEQIAYGLMELLNGCSAGDGMQIVQKERTVPKNQCSVSRILKSGPYTHVFWSDGTKTSVKRSPEEPDNDYAAFTAALAIKMYGSNSALKRMLRDKIEVQKPKKSTKGTSTGTDTPSAECTDTCPIDFDAIQRNLKKAAESATKQIIESITGNAE